MKVNAYEPFDSLKEGSILWKLASVKIKDTFGTILTFLIAVMFWKAFVLFPLVSWIIFMECP